MSTITNEVKLVYVPFIYDIWDHEIAEGPDYDREQDAIAWAYDRVSEHVQEEWHYYYAKIEKRVVPVYK